MVPLKGLSLIVLLAIVILVSGCTQLYSSVLTPEQVLEQKMSLLNESINVRGVADVGRLICTLIECPPEDPCCNACGGELVIKGESESVAIRGVYQDKEIGCGGDECSQTCHPLKKGMLYEAIGVWSESFGEYFLELESFEVIQ